MLVLSAGTHHGPEQGGCLLEVASLLAGEPWGDEPACTHPVIAALARSVNDQVPDQDRHLKIALVTVVIGTAADPADSLAERWALTVRLVALVLVVQAHLGPTGRGQTSPMPSPILRCCAVGWNMPGRDAARRLAP